MVKVTEENESKSTLWTGVYNKLVDLKNQGSILVEVELDEIYSILLSVDDTAKTIFYATWDKEVEEKPGNLDLFLELHEDWEFLDDIYEKLVRS